MQPYMPCGTTAGARRHYRAGEKPCPACLEANRQIKRIERGTAPAAAREFPAQRAVRNGIPWKPYVYRGTGADACTGEVVIL
jgi:hypothetical protein